LFQFYSKSIDKYFRILRIETRIKTLTAFFHQNEDEVNDNKGTFVEIA